MLGHATVEVDHSVFTPSETATEKLCRGPLEVLAAVFVNVSADVTLKLDAMRALDHIRENLQIQQEERLEYVFARALFKACFSPARGSESAHRCLLDLFRSFDRNREEVAVATAHLPITVREAQLRNLGLIDSNKLTLILTFHIARAIDAEGPWGWTHEQEELMSILMKLLTGYDPRADGLREM